MRAKKKKPQPDTSETSRTNMGGLTAMKIDMEQKRI